MKLTIELVPSSCWYSNVRSNVKPVIWKKIQKFVFEKAEYKCEICNGIGYKHPVECHEIWEYDDINKIQTLQKCIALCPSCHQVKHYGLAMIQGKEKKVKKWLCKMNNISEKEANNYISNVFNIYNERSKYTWNLNIKWIEEII